MKKWVIVIVLVLCTAVVVCLWCCRTDKTDPGNYAKLRYRYWTRIQEECGTTWDVSVKVNTDKEEFEKLSKDKKIQKYEEAEKALK